MSDEDLSDSDNSFSESITVSGDEPPTLDETLYDISLFNMFLAYMKSLRAESNLLFLKQARLFSVLNVPRSVYMMFGLRMIWDYFSDCADSPVAVSAEVRNTLKEIAVDPDKELTLNKEMFSAAFGEVYNTVTPHFRNWIATNEWHDAVPFHRLAPPTFNVVLGYETLQVIFNKYIKSQLDFDGDGSVNHAYHLWKFCIIANDFRDGKLSHSSRLERKKKKKKKSGDENADAGGKPMNSEEYAKLLYKKYKQHITLPYDGSAPYSVFVIRALDNASEEFDKSALFAHWISLKQYLGVDYQGKVMHQSLTDDGFAEPPSIAGAITSSMLPFFLVLMHGTENGLNLEFIVDVLKFRHTFNDNEVTSSSSTGNSSRSKSSSSSDSTQKNMVTEARRIFSKYLDSGEMYCDPNLVEEVRAALGGKTIKPTLFQKCGAFIYQRSEHTWAREARATFGWANKSFDNHSKAARMVEEEFSLSVLPDGIDLQVVPSLDDTLGSPELTADYGRFCGEETNHVFRKFKTTYIQYFETPVSQRRTLLPKIAKRYGFIANLFPELKPFHRVFTKECSQRVRVSDSMLLRATASAVCTIAKKYYKNWVIEHSMVWKSVQWVPVKDLFFGDLSQTFGMCTIERAIQERALKGKTGLSKFFAKRQVKKQAIANIRTTSSLQLLGPSETVVAIKKPLDLIIFGGKSHSQSEGSSRSETLPMSIPSINETLTSSYLRQFFETTYLTTALESSELSLWEALTDFFVKYSSMDPDVLCGAQEEMRSDIDDICDKYKTLLRNSDEIKERARRQKIIFPHFFRPDEVELYATAHADFEGILRKKGWE